jgi:hypothetical protein
VNGNSESQSLNRGEFKALRLKCKAEGICCICFKRPVKAGTIHCQTCIRMGRTAHSGRYWWCRQNGLCVDCQTPVVKGHARCASCLAKVRVSSEKTRSKSVATPCADGLCRRCKAKPARPGRCWCVDCYVHDSVSHAHRYRSRRRSKLCVRCKKPALRGRCRCAECSEKYSYFRALRRKKKARSLEVAP